ncbi:hypothetical protein pb186bvf_008240 [Paramecium bursaria]
MHRRNDSKKNKMQIHIDRSVDLRDVRHSNNSPMSPYKLKLPSIFQHRTPSVRKAKIEVGKISIASVKKKYLTEHRRKSSLSAHKLQNTKRTRSISHMVSQINISDENNSGKIRLDNNFQKAQNLKIEIFEELRKMQMRQNDPRQVHSLRQSMMAVIEQSRLHRLFRQPGNTDQQLKILQQIQKLHRNSIGGIRN